MSDIYLDRLKALRDIGFPLAEAMRCQGRLNFDVYATKGEDAEGCLLGWFASTDYAYDDGWRFAESPRSVSECSVIWGGLSGWNAACEYFHIEDEQTDALFDGYYAGSLDDRLEVLNAIIAEKELGLTL